jgi:hypothetical protein
VLAGPFEHSPEVRIKRYLPKSQYTILNIYSMVERRVSSALIFEDDADWDVALKMQLVQFARGSRFLLNHTENMFLIITIIGTYSG